MVRLGIIAAFECRTPVRFSVEAEC
jgi:hypothetical protein